MTKASDNPFPSLLLAPAGIPAAPTSSQQRLYYSVPSSAYYSIASTGTSVRIGPPVGGSMTNPMTTTGDIIYASDNSGTPARLASATSTYLLMAQGAGTAPIWSPSASTVSFHGAKAYSTSNQTINTTNAALTFDAEEFDSDGYHDTVTNNSRFTVPSGYAGKYHLQGGVGANAANAGWLGFKLNGSTFIRGLASAHDSAAQYYQAQAIVSLVVGDYVELWFNTSANMTVGGGGTDNQKWMAVTFLGS